MKKLIFNLLNNELFKTLKIDGIKFPKMYKHNRSIFKQLETLFPQFNKDDILFIFTNKENIELLLQTFICKCGNFKHSNLNFCSRRCDYFKQSVLNKLEKTNLEKYGNKQFFNSKRFKEKSKQTCLEKYDSDTYWGSKQCKETRKQNNLKKYGVEHCTQAKIVQDKKKQTCLEKYGVDSYSKTKEYHNKVQKTNLEKYNKEYYTQTEKFKASFKKMMQEKYNINNPFQLKEVKEKSKQTCLEKYGKEYYTQTEQYKQQIEQTSLEKYGTKNPNQNETIKEKIKLTKIKNGHQYPDNIVDLFLAQWDKNRKPTAEDLQNYLKTNNLTYMYPLIKKSKKEDAFSINDVSYLESIIEDFLKNNSIKFVKHERKIIFPLELDFYLPDYKVAIEINDIMTHNSTFNPFGEPKPKNYHFNKTKLCTEKEIRLIHAFEPVLRNERQLKILKDIVLHACKKTKTIFARNTEVKIVPAIEMKQFIENNNIQGYRAAKKAFVLIDKNTKEPLMCYTIGKAFFGKGKYDAEIIRGASKLGYTVVGGASKLWKYITEYYKDKNLNDEPGVVNSIVYYVNLNYYDGKSMTFLSNTKFIKNQPSFWNYWVETKILKDREPHRHKEIQKLMQEGKILYIGNSGTQVNVWERN